MTAEVAVVVVVIIIIDVIARPFTNLKFPPRFASLWKPRRREGGMEGGAAVVLCKVLCERSADGVTMRYGDFSLSSFLPCLFSSALTSLILKGRMNNGRTDASAAAAAAEAVEQNRGEQKVGRSDAERAGEGIGRKVRRTATCFVQLVWLGRDGMEKTSRERNVCTTNVAVFEFMRTLISLGPILKIPGTNKSMRVSRLHPIQAENVVKSAGTDF